MLFGPERKGWRFLADGAAVSALLFAAFLFAFAVEAGKEIYVGHVTINLGNDDRAMIELSVSSDDGVACRANASIGR